VPEPGARRSLPDVFDFEGDGDEARHWLDLAYGTTLGLGGHMGTVSHRRLDRVGVAFDHLRIDSPVTFDADAMPTLVVVDVLRGEIEYTHHDVTDRARTGETVLAAGWDEPFSGCGNGYEVRNTSITADVLTAAIREVDPDKSREDLTFTSFVPRSPAAAARWRATVDELSASFPGVGAQVAHGEASRLLGRTLLHTFSNNLLDGASGHDVARDSRDATQATVRRAQDLIAARSHEDLALADLAQECGVTPRALQYAFRRHLGCTPLAYLKQVRLDLVHQLLCDGSALSVSDAAGRHGFFNPGRFAADYRRAFGENPRQTFSRASS
jgi:AraC-like DNA-binding protein